MTILMTGGTGFVGSYIARKLVEEGEDRLVLFGQSHNPASIQDIAEHVDIVQGDLADPLELMTVFKKYDISHVFHLAYFIFEDDKYRSRALRVNVLGTTNLFEIALMTGVQRVIWASSGAVYGFIPTSENAHLVSEDDLPVSKTLYGISKIFNENYAEHLAVTHGFDHITLRVNSTYGIGRAQRRGFMSWGVYPGSQDVYTNLIENTVRGEPVTTPPGNHLLVWSYAKDIALAFYCAYKAKKPKHRIFNYTGEIRPVKDAVDYLKSLFPNAPIKIGTEPATIVPYLDPRRAEAELGFKPQYSMQKGMKDYIDTLLSHQT